MFLKYSCWILLWWESLTWSFHYQIEIFHIEIYVFYSTFTALPIEITLGEWSVVLVTHRGIATRKQNLFTILLSYRTLDSRSVSCVTMKHLMWKISQQYGSDEESWLKSCVSFQDWKIICVSKWFDLTMWCKRAPYILCWLHKFWSLLVTTEEMWLYVP